MSPEQSQAPDFTLESTAGESVTLSETLDEAPTVVLINRGHWCSFCAEQLQTFSEVAYDLWFNDSVDVLPVVTDTVGKATEMRDRYDLDIQPLADPDGEVAEQYSGTERTSHGLTGVAATYVVDAGGTVRYEQVADHPGDRTYGNFVRYFIRKTSRTRSAGRNAAAGASVGPSASRRPKEQDFMRRRGSGGHYG